jgi:hypothetical protein
MRYIAVILLLLALVGCDKEVSRVPNGQPFVVHSTQSCQHFGYCYTCMPGLTEKSECGMKVSHYCDGHQNITVRKTPILITHESGKKESSYEDVTLSVDSGCY